MKLERLYLSASLQHSTIENFPAEEANILSGKSIVIKMRHQIKEEVKQLIEKTGFFPQLVTIQVGHSFPALIYTKNIKKACNEVGIKFKNYRLNENIEAELLMTLIHQLNQDQTIDGILLQTPLPNHLKLNNIVECVDPSKDIDGMHPYNIGRLAQGVPIFQSCTSSGLMLLLKMTKLPLKGKYAVIVGASQVGKPILLALMHAGCTVTVCDIFTTHLSHHVKAADILISAVGKAKLIKGDWIKPGAIVIDIGTSYLHGNIVGDVEFNIAKQYAKWITPVPGGISPLTVAILLENTLKAAKRNRLMQTQAK